MRFLFLLAVALSVSFIKPPTRWVAIGDSITYLNDHTGETGGRLHKGYLSRVTAQLPGVQYINQGHNGWTSGGIAGAIDQLGIPVADVYTVFLGTNDWWRGDRIGAWTDYARATGDTTVYGSFRIIVDKIRRLNDKARVVLITPLPRTDFVYINDPHNNAYGSYKAKAGQTLGQVAGAILDIGEKEHFTVVDLYHDPRFAIPHLVHFKRLKDPATGQYKDYDYPTYTTIPWNPSDAYPYPPEAMDMTFDGLHPSDKGDSVIAEALVKVL